MSRQKILIIGGTGSLGKSLLAHFVDSYDIAVFSRDEAKHVIIKRLYPQVRSLIGDIRDRDAVFGAIMQSQPDVIINASALKNVPEVEEVPMEGIKTSLLGTENLNVAAGMYSLYSGKDLKVLTISTDKATAPVNAYGMAKALQERLHIRSNRAGLICNAVRYGNVLESRGSLIPLLKERLKANKPFYITHPNMTRFFLTLDSSVYLIKRALEDEEGGKTFVPKIRSAKIVDVVEIYRDFYASSSEVGFSRIRPGEKIDELLICKEEMSRAELLGDIFAIHDILTDKVFLDITEPLCSGSPSVLMNKEELKKFLEESNVFN